MVIAVTDWGIVYAAVPKAGCSSVKAMLAKIDPNVTLPAPELLTNGTYHSIYPTRRFRAEAFARHRDAYSFTVVRDPIRRLMSVYTNRVVGLRDLHKSRMLKRRGVLPLDPDPDTFLLNLRRYMRLSSIVRHHTLPTSLFTGPDLSVYSQVFRTEQMDDVAHVLSERSGIPVEPARANKSSAKLLFDDLKPETRDSLRPFLMDEYKHLRAFIDNPLT